MDFLTSVEPIAVLGRTACFIILWSTVRLFVSNVLFPHSPRPVKQGTAAVVAIHSTIQAPAILWVFARDPVISPLLSDAWNGGQADLVNINSPGVSFLATLAAGEFLSQLMHVKWWYEKKSDLLMVAHHMLAGVFWTIGIMARRSHLFIGNFLLYELSTVFLGWMYFAKNTPHLHTILGTLFTLSFVVVRLTTIPITLYAFYATRSIPPLVQSWRSVLLALENVLIPVPIFLNIIWGEKVISGYVRAVRKKRAD